ncbi:ABC transporter ATP-binding protein [Bosea sp. (in: a-proteobacteria)]|uniref:ABC transporter ATP-binding protein n=1 Tax=Bosea sp. (in: a-proteobacteria) TaxID=1871050 RepID=UPI00263220C4|nr:ABC transporter ATP-binding protein [Bosea sp. (in: a-proteobacteria)]MCO5091269.1 ABC transporter ATP-binding protein [Bosea sp. (in: a-proteobacteria)]
MVDVTVERLSKKFGGLNAVDDVSFTVPSGTVLTLLGPSGCGKTTILRCIAGLETATGGRISIGGDPVFDSERDILVPSEKREIGMVFQSYAIWPHLTVFQNVAFPLKLRSVGKAELQERVMAALKSVDLDHLHDRYPNQLSGGQQQRAVLARCLVYRPRVLLLDEPLANLDAALREEMRFELREVQQKFGLTSIYVTHDQSEAMALSDNILVLSGGSIISSGSPREVFSKPQHRFVASFLGGANLIPARIVVGRQGPPQIVGIDAAGALLVEGEGDVGLATTVSVRPSDVSLVPVGKTDPVAVTGTLRRVTFLGEVNDCVVEIAGCEIRARTDPDGQWQIGETVGIAFHPSRTYLLAAEDK